MRKRKIIFGEYDTAAHGWTLTGWQLTAAEQKTNFVDKPAGDGSWDLSTALTGGVARYSDRSLTATFECSEGDRTTRELTIRRMINTLDGMRVDITLPDDDTHFISGRLHVAREYNDLAHAAVTVTAVCSPWKHAKAETFLPLTLTAEKQKIILTKDGRRTVVPDIKVTGGPMFIEYDGEITEVPGDGETYQWSALVLTSGAHRVTVSGAGTALISYREAVLE